MTETREERREWMDKLQKQNPKLVDTHESHGSTLQVIERNRYMYLLYLDLTVTGLHAGGMLFINVLENCVSRTPVGDVSTVRELGYMYFQYGWKGERGGS